MLRYGVNDTGLRSRLSAARVRALATGAQGAAQAKYLCLLHVYFTNYSYLCAVATARHATAIDIYCMVSY